MSLLLQTDDVICKFRKPENKAASVGLKEPYRASFEGVHAAVPGIVVLEKRMMATSIL